MTGSLAFRGKGDTRTSASAGTVPGWVRAVARLALEYRRPLVVGVQLVLVVLSNYVAFWLRFEGDIPPREFATFSHALGWLLAIRAITFVPFRLYAGLWRYTGLWDLRNIVVAVLSSSAVFYFVLRVVLDVNNYSRSVLLIDALLLIIALSAIRLVRRLVPHLWAAHGSTRVLIFGAGDAGEMIVGEMRSEACGYEPIGFVDDDPAKAGVLIDGLPVLGGGQDLRRIIEKTKPDEILIAMPRAAAPVIRRIVQRLQPFGLRISTLPSIKAILDGRVSVDQIRPIEIEHLLLRAPVDLEIEPVRALIAGSRVLVTGAGGSIGSELCRQIASLLPASLVLFERYENALYEVTNDLTDRFGARGIAPVIGDVTDRGRVEQVMLQYRPRIVFHAAAHKHVPLMEHNPCEAVKNNIVGTATVAEAAHRCGVERFIMISTDKAVNPASVMGATKRVGEMILTVINRRSATRFAVVRFGNVLGSNGSVIPRFLSQIRAGGPVTVTHPDMRRYFMSIPEAVQLVLHAAALGEPGAIYVLEMGEQIPLIDMARTLIRSAGLDPQTDIPITVCGLRPGEKLFEELVGRDETAEPSSVPKITRVRGRGAVDPDALAWNMEALVNAALDGESAEVIRQLQFIVPTFDASTCTGRSDVFVDHPNAAPDHDAAPVGAGARP